MDATQSVNLTFPRGYQNYHLKGTLGDSLHAMLCAAGYNIRWLLRMIVKKERDSKYALFCACKKLLPAQLRGALEKNWTRSRLC